MRKLFVFFLLAISLVFLVSCSGEINKTQYVWCEQDFIIWDKDGKLLVYREFTETDSCFGSIKTAKRYYTYRGLTVGDKLDKVFELYEFPINTVYHRWDGEFAEVVLYDGTYDLVDDIKNAFSYMKQSHDYFEITISCFFDKEFNAIPVEFGDRGYPIYPEVSYWYFLVGLRDNRVFTVFTKFHDVDATIFNSNIIENPPLY